jgi:hypothetical protein
MKKQLFFLMFIGLICSSLSSLQASLDDHDMQKISANKLENKAWKNGQSVVSSLAFFSLLGTGFFGINALQTRKKDDKPILYGLTVACGLAHIGLDVAWYKIFKKRAKRHGYENNKLTFWFVDLVSQLDEGSR